MFDEKRPHSVLWGANGAIGYLQNGVRYGPNKQPLNEGEPEKEAETNPGDEAADAEAKEKPKRTRKPPEDKATKKATKK